METITQRSFNPENYGKFFLAVEKFEKKGLRIGQSYMNALGELDKELYNEVTATDDDCFYDDTKVPRFLIRIF